DVLHADGFAQDRMMNVFDLVNQFGPRIFQMVFGGAEVGMHHDEGVLCDRARQYGAAFTVIELSDVRAAAGKADAERSAGNDHDLVGVEGMTRSASWRWASTAGHSSSTRVRQSASIAVSSRPFQR